MHCTRRQQKYMNFLTKTCVFKENERKILKVILNHMLVFVDAYIVKLFDRSVDLAPFSETSPLYPICRSWMRNSANEQYIEQPVPQQVPVRIVGRNNFMLFPL